MVGKTDSGITSEAENWNVAGDYARLKIMKPLYLADEFELIATFGTVSFFDEMRINVNRNVLKIRGFKRLVRCLLMVINNSLFAIKNDRQKLLDLKEELERINKIIPLLTTKQVNQVRKTSEIKLIEDKYDSILDRVIEIKAEINGPLNKNHLIFTQREEFSIKAFKNPIKERMIGKG